MTEIAQPVQTTRLALIPATAAHLRAELEAPTRLGELLGVTVPASWPPGEYDRPAQTYFLRCLEAAGPAGVGWYGWYAVQRPAAAPPPVLVAVAGYVGPPTREGIVEIGYSVVPEYQRRGYATEIVRALLARAQAQPVVRQVVAHTTEVNTASIAVLTRSGFTLVGPGAEPGTLRFAVGWNDVG